MGYKVGFLRPGQTQAPPTGLGCAIDTAVDPPALNLTWTVPAGAVYDAIEVLRDGAVIESLPGASASYSTTELVIGQHQYGVRAIAGGTPLPAVSCFVSYCPGVLHVTAFETADIAAFNGRNNPDHFFWGEIASQLGKRDQFKSFWTGGPRAPDEKDWLKLFDGDRPILILLDEMLELHRSDSGQTPINSKPINPSGWIPSSIAPSVSRAEAMGLDPVPDGFAELGALVSAGELAGAPVHPAGPGPGSHRRPGPAVARFRLRPARHGRGAGGR